MLDGKKALLAILGAILAVVILLVWHPFLRLLVHIFPFFPFNGIEKLGQYGDSFGALTAICTAAAFLVLCLTLIAQKEELRLQREELKLQRKEMEKSRETFDGQKKVMALQLFETTLFNLLQQHHQILSSYSMSDEKGIHALRSFINLRMQFTHIESMKIFNTSVNNQILVLQNLYYNVCSLIEHVENDAPDFIDKNKYKKIISRQLYLEEKVLLCVKCWKLKDDNMKSLFWDYVFDNQELEVMGFEKPLIDEINTYFNPNP